jgi:uncharacterized membrane protein
MQHVSRKESGDGAAKAVNRRNTSQRERPVAGAGGKRTPRSAASLPVKKPQAAPRRTARNFLDGSPWRPLVLSAICLAGVGISIYLLIVHYDRGALICNTSGVVNCSKVLTSPSSVIFGIPVPIFGLLYFIGMGAICLPFAWRSEWAWLAWGRLAGAVAGIGMVVYLIYQEALVLHTICLWCTGVHVLTFAMFLIILTGWEDTGYARSRWE